MEKLNVVVALTTRENDYQAEQAVAAAEVAARLGIKIQILYADNDAVNQTQQLIKIIQDPAPPSAILVEPVGTGMPQVAKAAVRAGIDRVLDVFPVLKERRHQSAGYLSGGEQQMLVIGRALMSDPKVILLDEPSLGLAPMVIEEIFGVIRRLKDEQKITVLLVEQNAALALDIADHGYVTENGRIVLEGPAESLRENSDIKEFYLGLNEAGARKSYRDNKHYRRRKRWLS